MAVKWPCNGLTQDSVTEVSCWQDREAGNRAPPNMLLPFFEIVPYSSRRVSRL